MEFPFGTSQQVRDVIPLEEPIAQGLEHRATLCFRYPLVDERIPSGGQLLQLRLVLDALRLDRLAGALEARGPFLRRRAALAKLTNLVELLVQREHFLEQRRRHLTRGL